MILFPVLFVLCSSVMSYNVGVLHTKNKAIEQESFCLKDNDCYSVFQENDMFSFTVGQKVITSRGKGFIWYIEDDTIGVVINHVVTDFNFAEVTPDQNP